MALSQGDTAPDFERKASDGSPVRLSQFRDKKPVVLFFYPKDFTRVCTEEACGFRDLTKELGTDNVEVFGISSDPADSHEKFRTKHNLGFRLLSDEDKSLAKQFGATNLLLGLAGMTKRVTVVVDKSGRVAEVISDMFSADQHIEGVRAALQRLS